MVKMDLVISFGLSEQVQTLASLRTVKMMLLHLAGLSQAARIAGAMSEM